jgi:hypothetical protein
MTRPHQRHYEPQRTPKSFHKRNDGKPLTLSFYESMIYTGLDRTMLEFCGVYHLRFTRVELNHLTLEELAHIKRFARLYNGVPPARMADVITFSRPRGRPHKRLIPHPDVANP